MRVKNLFMSTVPAIIDSFGRLSRFGRACGISDYPSQRAWDMRRRGRIPTQYWASLIEAAPAYGVTLSLEMMLAAHTVQAEHAA